MKDGFIHESASIKESELGDVKLFKNVHISNSILHDGCSVGDDTTIERCSLENNVVINRRSYVNDSKIGMYSYTGINSTINWSAIGKFCSFGRNVDIGGFDHDYKKVTTMPAFRFFQLEQGGGKLLKTNYSKKYCEIGNDVWIAAGAQVLHKVRIGDGAVIGGGAVVTHDVPPYAVAAGVPARIIALRCEEKWIDKLLELKWWDWPLEVIKKNMQYFMENDITQKTIEELQRIADSCWGKEIEAGKEYRKK